MEKPVERVQKEGKEDGREREEIKMREREEIKMGEGGNRTGILKRTRRKKSTESCN